MNAWWQGLQPRERRLVVLGGIALAAMAFYFMLWLPPHREARDRAERLENLRADIAWMQQAAAEYNALGGVNARSGGASRGTGQALYALADQTARAAGLGSSIQRVEPSGDDQVRVALRAASFDDIVRWLGRLREEHGIRAESVSIRRVDEPGRTDVQLLLNGGA